MIRLILDGVVFFTAMFWFYVIALMFIKSELRKKDKEEKGECQKN